MTASRVSAIVLTYNEAGQMAACLDTLRWVDELIVVDSGSTDGTVEIARRYAARVEVWAPYPGYARQRNRALGLATGDWILCVDADERCPHALASEIRERIASTSAAALAVRSRNVVFGRWLRSSYWWPQIHTRLFRRGAARWEEREVHPPMVADGAVELLDTPIEHYPYPRLGTFLEKQWRYTSWEALEKIKTGARPGWTDVLRLPVRPLTHFWRLYVVRDGWRDGWQGWLMSLLMALYPAVAEGKWLWRVWRPGLPHAGGVALLCLLACAMGLTDRGVFLERLPDILNADRNELGLDPAVWRAGDPTLFPGGDLFTRGLKLQPEVTSVARSVLGSLAGPFLGSVICYVVLNAVFASGLFYWYRRLLGLGAGWVASILTLVWPYPNLTWQARWGAVPVDWLTYRGVTLALVPWMFWAAARPGGAGWLVGCFAGLGLVAGLNPHGLAQAALAGLGGVMAASGRSGFWRALGAAAVFGLVWLGWIIPLLQGYSRPDLASLALLNPAVLSPWWPTSGPDVLRHLAWAAGLGALSLALVRPALTSGIRFLCGVGLVGLLGAMLGALQPWMPALIVPQPARLARFGYAWAIGLVALAASTLWMRRKAGPRGLAVALVAMAVLRMPTTRTGVSTPGLLPHDSPWKFPAEPADQVALVHVGGWARKATSRGARFLVPPDGAEAFRAHAQRSIFVSSYDGLWSHYSGEFGRAWRQRYLAAREAYAQGGGVLVQAARRLGCSYIVTAQDGPVPAQEVFVNDRYHVYRVQQ